MRMLAPKMNMDPFDDNEYMGGSTRSDDGSETSSSSHSSSSGSADSSTFNPNTVTGRWTQEEHELFIQGIRLHNKQWKLIAELIRTRTVVQIRTHAQKYFQKLQKSKGFTIDVGSDDRSIMNFKANSESSSPREKNYKRSFNTMADSDDIVSYTNPNEMNVRGWIRGLSSEDLESAAINGDIEYIVGGNMRPRGETKRKVVLSSRLLDGADLSSANRLTHPNNRTSSIKPPLGGAGDIQIRKRPASIAGEHLRRSADAVLYDASGNKVSASGFGVGTARSNSPSPKSIAEMSGGSTHYDPLSQNYGYHTATDSELMVGDGADMALEINEWFPVHTELPLPGSQSLSQQQTTVRLGGMPRVDSFAALLAPYQFSADDDACLGWLVNDAVPNTLYDMAPLPLSTDERTEKVSSIAANALLSSSLSSTASSSSSLSSSSVFESIEIGSKRIKDESSSNISLRVVLNNTNNADYDSARTVISTSSAPNSNYIYPSYENLGGIVLI